MGEGNGNPLQYSCLENPVDGGAWWGAVYGAAQSRTWLKRLSMHACIGEGMANHSSILAWRIPGTEEPGGLPSMWSHRVGHDWSDLAAAAAAAKISDRMVKCVPETDSWSPFQWCIQKPKFSFTYTPLNVSGLMLFKFLSGNYATWVIGHW